MIIYAQERVNYYPIFFTHARFTINGLNRQNRIQKCSNENNRHFLNPLKAVSIKRVKFLRSSEVSLHSTDIKTTIHVFIKLEPLVELHSMYTRVHTFTCTIL